MAAQPAPMPENEAQRLAALRRYGILDTPAEAPFDDLTALASFICNTPIALVSLIDEDRQWFKSEVGLGVRETPRDMAFCAHAILQDDVFVVPDAASDPRFATNPLVDADPLIRFYAGAPLVTDDGYKLGTLCVIDRVPRTLTEAQRAALQALSRQAITQLEMRRHLADLHEAYTRLHVVDRLKSEFVSMVSHELRTPLTSIRGGLQLVLANGGMITDSDTRELLAGALNSSERLIRITNDILDMSKLEAGRVELHWTRGAVADVVATACAAVAHLPRAMGRVRSEVAADAGDWFVDGDRLVQALVNLLGNALKFSPVSTPVTIEAQRRDGRVVIAVRDEGPGIAPDDLVRLFQPFQQLSNAKQVGGTGLGLVITKGIVEQHGGTLEVASRVGFGTVFTLSVPAGDAAP